MRRWQGKDKPVMKRQIYIEVGLLVLAVLLFKGPTLQAYSATSLVALIIGIMAWTGLWWAAKFKKYSLRFGVLLLLCVVVANGISTPWRKGKTVVAEGDTAGAMGTLGRDSSFTGRSEIWASLLPDVKRSPILGAGFGSFWTPTAKISHDIGEAHNGYLDVTLDLGFVGLFLVVMFFLSSCKKALDAMAVDPDWGSLVACYVLMTAMHNTAESSINSFTTHLSTLLVFLTVTLRAALQRQPKAEVKNAEPNKAESKGTEGPGVFAMPSNAS
jgi:O-antigen ligase